MLSRWIIFSSRNISKAIHFCSQHVSSNRGSTVVLPPLPPMLVQVAQEGCKALYCAEIKTVLCTLHKLPTEVFLEVLGRSLEQAEQTIINKLPSQALQFAEQLQSAGKCLYYGVSGSLEQPCGLQLTLACLDLLSTLLHCSFWDTAPCPPARPRASVASVPEQSWVRVSQHICFHKYPALIKAEDANLKTQYFYDSVDFKDICVGNVTDAPIVFVCCLLLIISFKRLWLGSKEEDAPVFTFPW